MHVVLFTWCLPAEGMFRRHWLRAAAERYDARAFAEAAWDYRVTLGVDVAASVGGDQTVVAVCRGPTLERFVAWRERDLAVGEDRLVALANEYTSAMVDPRFPNYGARPSFIVDVVGAGVPGHLRRRGFFVTEFNGGAQARHAERFQNARAEWYWALRDLMAENRVAIPSNAMFEEEFLATEWQVSQSGRLVQVIGKDLIRKAIGRSPDRLDAAVMALVQSVGLARLGWGATTHEVYQ